MKRVTRDDIIGACGRVDDVTIAEIIGTGATVDELAEAQAWIANDEPLMNAAAKTDDDCVPRIGSVVTFRPFFL